VIEVDVGRGTAAVGFGHEVGDQREKVEAVVMDMSAAFLAAAEAKMPHAEIVHDRFHVAKHLNEVLVQMLLSVCLCLASRLADFKRPGPSPKFPERWLLFRLVV